MNEVKILHVIARMNVGGTARYLDELVRNIPGSALATGYVQDGEIEDPVISDLLIYRIKDLGRKISLTKDVKSWFELRKLVNELQPAILHTHTFKAGLIGRLIRGKHKHVHTFHGHLLDDDSFSSLKLAVIILLERYLAKKTDLLVSVGDRVGLELREIGIGTNLKWCSIPPGVYKLPVENRLDAREKLGLDPHRTYVGWIARITAVKNPFLLLEVARELPQIQFLMAGGGDLLGLVTKQAPANVSILGWCEAATFFSSVDCVISTSNNEGMPIALIEAQLAGIPVVATAVGSNAEVIQDGVTGIIVEKNVKALSQALTDVLSRRIASIANSEEIASIAEIQFSPNKMIKRHIEKYSELFQK